MARSCNESGREFQTVGPVAEKAWVPNVLQQHCGIFSLSRQVTYARDEKKHKSMKARTDQCMASHADSKPLSDHQAAQMSSDAPRASDPAYNNRFKPENKSEYSLSMPHPTHH